MQTPPPLCDYEQWIDTEIKKEDKDFWDGMNQWDAEINERLEIRRKQEAEKRAGRGAAKEVCCKGKGGEREEA